MMNNYHHPINLPRNLGSKSFKPSPGGAGGSFFFPKAQDNVCAGKADRINADRPNKVCADLSVAQPQAGANVTLGFKGSMPMNGVTVSQNPFYKSGMCPVNVHWHLGAEHYSYGQYDEAGFGPQNTDNQKHRDMSSGVIVGEVASSSSSGEAERLGFRCRHYDSKNPSFAKPYKWKHCSGMVVGETYEVHWPHSAAGACGTVDQYQTPFRDGVFCNLTPEQVDGMLGQDIANSVGVQAQVFTIINDESYFYPDLIKGMVTYKVRDMGTDVTFYSGSTTGQTVNNTMCSQYTPITWQVDRKCHLISASSFDKLCSDMKMQRDDMSEDLHPHGSRELVTNNLAADNQQFAGDRDRKKNLRRE